MDRKLVAKIKGDRIAVMCILFLTLVSCRKTGSLAGGTEIRFLAESEASITKTSYSGDIFEMEEGGYKERIDWEVNDTIRIACAEANASEFDDWADYKITAVEDGGEKSLGFLAPVNTGLLWNDWSIEYDFYALYPSPATYGMGGISMSINALGECISNLKMPGSQVMTSWTSSGSKIVGSPDMRYAYMFAHKHSGYSSSVKLTFEPVFTAFQFQISAPPDNDVGLLGFYLISPSSVMGGRYQMKCDSDHVVSLLEPSEDVFSVYVGFPPGFTIPANGMLDFTIFALPQQYDDLRIVFNGTPGTFDWGVISLELMDNLGNHIEFPPYGKYVISGLTFPANTLDGGTKSPVHAGSRPLDSFEDGVVVRDGEICLNMADENFNHEWVVLEKK